MKGNNQVTETKAELLEARTGVEPVNKGFADLCLTTWLPRRSFFQDIRLRAKIQKQPRGASSVSLMVCPPFR